MTNFLIINALFTKLYNDMQSWAYTNSVVVNAGGFTIGYSTYYFITSLLALLTPIILILTKKFEKVGKIIGLEKKGIVYEIIKFISNIIILTGTWLFTLLITFLLLEYVLNIQLLGLKSNIKDNEKKDFIVSKTEASLYEPIVENSKKLEIKNEKEKLIGTKILKTEENSLNNIKIIDDIETDHLEIFNKDQYNTLITKLF
tara:strand:+ start:2788 stop:3390 length:603 start_codon:yes stop_codon:yes gene_type:complete